MFCDIKKRRTALTDHQQDTHLYRYETGPYSCGHWYLGRKTETEAKVQKEIARANNKKKYNDVGCMIITM